ncbi:thiamine phosphate synthase [Altererythrobacter sp. SALINAS58]|nr:thiamine phosphate synthase [Alteripontixanthobacter muriae]
MPPRQTPLPIRWLLSDARNDAVLEDALRALPPNSGFVFRHYHLDPVGRRQRFYALSALARRSGHLVILSADAETARQWGADGIYGSPEVLPAPSTDLLRLATVHDQGEMQAANAVSADAAFVSPVFATRSHAGAPVLGPSGYARLAAQAEMPVIALGGMTPERAAALGCARWAAVDWAFGWVGARSERR